MRIFVPMDSAAKALGADLVAAALAAAAPDAEIIRTGTRGMIWLEPLVEVEIDGVRQGYGPATPEDAAAILDGSSEKALGPVEELDWVTRQARLTFARVGVIAPLSLSDYEAHGGLSGLRRALDMTGEEIVGEVTASGLRGRGGAGFPTGIKWKTVLEADAPQKYIVCNADEGDSGTFADRMLMEGDPFLLIEGMTIAAIAVGATKGYIYLRSEYPHAHKALQRAILKARNAGVLGASVLGSGKAFELEVRLGAGAYICGEETSLLESLEGNRAIVRAKPPIPALQGLFGKPTVVNNVLTLAAVPHILSEGGAALYESLGIERSKGTMPVQLARNIRRGGLYEIAFGITLRELVNDIGGGTASGRPVKAVQVGGPLGAYLHPDQFDLPFDYEAYAAADGLIGHGGITVFDDTADMGAMAKFAFEFCAAESCGKCTPCRIGSVRGGEIIDRILAGGREPDRLELSPQMHNAVKAARGKDEQVQLLEDLCEVMRDGSLCALGGFTPYPVLSAIRHWPEDFGLGD